VDPKTVTVVLGLFLQMMVGQDGQDSVTGFIVGVVGKKTHNKQFEKNI
jgi:hypothetical protein